MVTHILSSKNSSSTSLPLSSPSSSTFRPAYASSQAGSSSAPHRQTRRPPSSSYITSDRHHHRSSSTASLSSQTTLVSNIPPSPQTLAGYPKSPPSAYSYATSNTSYRDSSVASTSAVRELSGHRRRANNRGRSRRELERESDTASLNTFPHFGQTGDVELLVRDYRGRYSKRYLLHRLILAQNSEWFEDDLAVDKSHRDEACDRLLGEATNVTINGSRKMWRYGLDWSSIRGHADATPLLVQKNSPRSQASFASLSHPPPSSTRNKPQAPPNTFFRDLASSLSTNPQSQASEDSDLLTAYDNLFLIFYNHTPSLSTTNIATAYVESKLLLFLASSYSALHVVGPRIDYHLLQFGTRLWKQIAKYPPSYLKLGHLARSNAIFSEALVHVVGQWPIGQPQLKRGTVEDEIIDLIEDKVDELEETILKVEAKLFRLSLTTGRGERVGPSNAYVDWLAISLFRQWVADNTARAPPGILKDSPPDAGRTGLRPGTTASRAGTSNQQPPGTTRNQPQTPPKLVRTYRLLGQGGQAYLSHDDLKRFLKLRPEDYSRDVLRKFERRIGELKHLARDAVRPLTRSWLELEYGGAESAGGSSAPSYLTCARCEERDFAYVWRQ